MALSFLKLYKYFTKWSQIFYYSMNITETYNSRKQSIFVLKMQFYFSSPDYCFSAEQFLNILILNFKLLISYVGGSNENLKSATKKSKHCSIFL